MALGIAQIVAAIGWLASDVAALAETPRDADAVVTALAHATWTGAVGVCNSLWLDASILLAAVMIVGGAGIIARRAWGRTLSLVTWTAALVGLVIDQVVFFWGVYPAVARVEGAATSAREGDRFHAEIVALLVTNIVIAVGLAALVVAALIVLTRPRVRDALQPPSAAHLREG